MAKQMGMFPIQGTIGNVTFFKTIDGFTIRPKGGVSAARIASDPAYARTRENMSEFSASAKTAQLIRRAFAPLINLMADGRMFSRLAKLVRLAINADEDSQRGQRNMAMGNPALLDGFEFNRVTNLSVILSAPYTATIERATGTMAVTVPAFIPEHRLQAPVSATHFSFMMGAGAIDFTGWKVSGELSESEILPLGAALTIEQNLACAIGPNPSGTLVLALGIRFYQKLNRNFYPLADKSFNALAIVKVDV